jgi:hypothetical protein
MTNCNRLYSIPYWQCADIRSHIPFATNVPGAHDVARLSFSFVHVTVKALATEVHWGQVPLDKYRPGSQLVARLSFRETHAIVNAPTTGVQPIHYNMQYTITVKYASWSHISRMHGYQNLHKHRIYVLYTLACPVDHKILIHTDDGLAVRSVGANDVGCVRQHWAHCLGIKYALNDHTYILEESQTLLFSGHSIYHKAGLLAYSSDQNYMPWHWPPLM